MYFILKFFNKPVMSNHVIISSAKPCKQSEIIITFASTNHVLSNQFLSFGFAIQRLLSCKEPHFSQINYDVDLATAQSKIKTSIFSLPQPPLPPAVLTEIVTDVWGPFVVHWICESIHGCHLLRHVLVVCVFIRSVEIMHL